MIWKPTAHYNNLCSCDWRECVSKYSQYYTKTWSFIWQVKHTFLLPQYCIHMHIWLWNTRLNMQCRKSKAWLIDWSMYTGHSHICSAAHSYNPRESVYSVCPFLTLFIASVHRRNLLLLLSYLTPFPSFCRCRGYSPTLCKICLGNQQLEM